MVSMYEMRRILQEMQKECGDNEVFQVVVYKNSRGFEEERTKFGQDVYVIRPFKVREHFRTTSEFICAMTTRYGEIRGLIPDGMTWIPRDKHDDPYIIETYI